MTGITPDPVHRIRLTPPGFTLLRELGAGGMGVVYEAEQHTPSRRVAIKLLRAPLASRERAKRFEIEANALARLHHPCVATIYETGVVESDVGPCPYIVMELIDGQPITEFAVTAGLTVRQRLEAMAMVADAVHHAHTRAVIHRDLKPPNVLVSATMGVRVVDFGLARVADSDTPDPTRHTTDGQLMGTIAYMSPEQIADGAAEASTGSDIYALGVLLYELLSGTLPLGLDECSLAEAARRVRDERPVPLGRLDRALRGDIERIVAMAMQHDPSKRYASAKALADDIRSHLADRPIVARPASTVDQFRRFARRHRALTAAGVLTAASGLFAVASLAYTLRTTQLERAEARAQAATAGAVLAFLSEDVLGSIDPESLPPAGLTMRQVLDRAGLDLDAGRFSDRPFVELALRRTIGRTYMNLTDYELAQPHLERAFELAVRYRFGTDDEVDAANTLAMLYMDQGDADRADAVLARAVELVDRGDGPTLLALETRNNLGAVRYRQGRFEDSAKILEEADGLATENAAGSSEALSIKASLAVALTRVGRLDDAEVYAREAMTAYRARFGEEHPQTLTAKNNLAGLLTRLERSAEAEALFRDVLEVRRRRLGEDHVDTLITRATLANFLVRAGRTGEAAPEARIAATVLTERLGADHPYARFAADTLRRVQESLDEGGTGP